MISRFNYNVYRNVDDSDSTYLQEHHRLHRRVLMRIVLLKVAGNGALLEM